MGSLESVDSTSFLRSKRSSFDPSASFSSSKVLRTSSDRSSDSARVCSPDALSWSSSEDDATKDMYAARRPWESFVGSVGILECAEPQTTSSRSLGELHESADFMSQEDTRDAFPVAERPSLLQRSASLFNGAISAPGAPPRLIRSSSGSHAQMLCSSTAKSPERKRSCIRADARPPSAGPRGALNMTSGAETQAPTACERFLLPPSEPIHNSRAHSSWSVLVESSGSELTKIPPAPASEGSWNVTQTLKPLARVAALKHRSASLSERELKSADTSLPSAPLMRRCTSQIVPSGASDANDTAEPKKKLDNFKDPESQGMEAISAETASKLFSGAPEMRALYDRVIVIDCRFSYEFEGGHIRVPDHLAGWLEVQHIPPHECKKTIDLFFQGGGVHPLPGATIGQDRVCAIFHCEFSQRRGPDMLKLVRKEDRDRVPFDRFPQLHYPECYVLEKGYKKFWETYPHMCEPSAYVPEQDERFVAECRHFNKLRRSCKQTKRGKAQSRRMSPADEDHTWEVPPRMSDE